jgi:hypothetical protein
MNPVCVEPAATITAAGTLKAELLLSKLRVTGDVAAAVRYTEQAIVPEPVKYPLLQETEVSAGAPVAMPVPLRAIEAVGAFDELLMMVN